MKSRMIYALALLVLLPASWAWAQQTMEFEVPFQFAVGSKVLPEGKYTVDVQPFTRVLLVRSADSKHAAIIAANAAHAVKLPDKGQLVFNRYGDSYFLSKIWWPANPSGCQLTKSSREREVAARTAEIQLASVRARQ